MSDQTSSIHSTPEKADQPVAEPRRPFIEPRLTFVAPKLVKQGDVTKLTQQFGSGGSVGFFGSFSP